MQKPRKKKQLKNRTHPQTERERERGRSLSVVPFLQPLGLARKKRANGRKRKRAKEDRGAPPHLHPIGDKDNPRSRIQRDSDGDDRDARRSGGDWGSPGHPTLPVSYSTGREAVQRSNAPTGNAPPFSSLFLQDYRTTVAYIYFPLTSLPVLGSLLGQTYETGIPVKKRKRKIRYSVSMNGKRTGDGLERSLNDSSETQ